MKLIRRKYGRGFGYLYPDGNALDSTSKQERDIKRWIKTLTIPPAWVDVEIDLNRSAKIHATGRDQNNKKQYIYNAKWRDKRNQEKFARIQRFAAKLETMRRVTGQHLRGTDFNKADRSRPGRNQVLACMVRLIDMAYFRPGNTQYTAENDTYGLTTLRSKHLKIDRDELIFEYQGKSGVDQIKQLEDARLAKIVAELDDLPGYRIFKYFQNGQRNFVNSEDLNDYIREVMGEEFSAKDFRTWAGTALAAISLAELDISEDETVRNQNILRSIEGVAKKLGNTPAVCRDNYIDARVIDAYIDGTTIKHIKATITQKLGDSSPNANDSLSNADGSSSNADDSLLSADEYAILTLLEQTV